MLASNRRHAKDDTALMTELKTDWCHVQKLLGRSRDKAGSLMPGWIVMQRRPTYVITRLSWYSTTPLRHAPNQVPPFVKLDGAMFVGVSHAFGNRCLPGHDSS